jgi:hypothetical protein
MEDDLFFHRGRNLEALLNHSPRSPEAIRGFAGLANRSCFAQRSGVGQRMNEFGFTPELLRGQLFRALYRRQFPELRTVSVPSAESADIWHVPAEDAFYPMQMLGECVVRLAPDVSRAAVFDHEPGDEGEDGAFAELTPHLSRCIAPGSTIRFSRGLLEGVMAEAIYHFTTGAPVDISRARQS